MLEKRLIEEVDEREVRRILREGNMCYSSSKLWYGDKKENKGRFFMNFSTQRKHWPSGKMMMKTVQLFAMEVEKKKSFFLDISREDTEISSDTRTCAISFLYDMIGGYIDA